MLVHWLVSWLVGRSVGWLHLFFIADFAVSRLAETYYCPCPTAGDKDSHLYSTAWFNIPLIILLSQFFFYELSLTFIFPMSFLAICLLPAFFNNPSSTIFLFSLFFSIFAKRQMHRQISGWYEELGAQYPHPKPYSDLVLPQLGQGGKSYPPATQGDSIRAPKQPETHKTTVFRCPPICQISG